MSEITTTVELDSADARPNTYDLLPYASHPYAQSIPARMAAVAALYGLRAAPIDRCRVLEIGCSTGGNIFPLAEQFPDSEFVGIDASARQVAEGQQMLRDAELANVRLVHKDVNDFADEYGRFDYVICHGVYSWVEPHTQEKILDVCSSATNPTGLAYVSYNTFPGWHFRGLVRDFLSFRTRGESDPKTQLALARDFSKIFISCFPEDGDGFAAIMRDEFSKLGQFSDHYVFHEHLEADNSPCYFYEFDERARGKGLKYVGEAIFSSMFILRPPEAVKHLMRSSAKNRVEEEQYLDFLRNRPFRQTILCHQDAAMSGQPTVDSVASMFVSSSLRPDSPEDAIRSDAPVRFSRGATTFTSADPFIKAAFFEIAKRHPFRLSFQTLLNRAMQSLYGGLALLSPQVSGNHREHLSQAILDGCKNGLIDVSVIDSCAAANVTERPAVTKFVRQQARRGDRVTNLHHESVRLDDLQRAIIVRLDGNHTKSQICDFLYREVRSGRLIAHTAEKGSGGSLQDRIPQVVDNVVGGFLRNALLLKETDTSDAEMSTREAD